MTQVRTKDENFLLKLYQMVHERGDLKAAFDRYAIGTMVGLSSRVVDNITKGLTKSNFVKKHGAIEITITPNGIALAETLLQ